MTEVETVARSGPLRGWRGGTSGRMGEGANGRRKFGFVWSKKCERLEPKGAILTRRRGLGVGAVALFWKEGTQAQRQEGTQGT